MHIIEEKYAWKGSLPNRNTTDYIVMHHAAASRVRPQDIHAMHVKKGWAGIGYHFFVSKDGKVYRGRPLNAVGAQCEGCNNRSIGICAEGNYQYEIMPQAQKVAIIELLRYVTGLYPQAQIAGHRDLNVTACPGANYPFDEIVAPAGQKGEGEEMVRYQKLRDIPNDYGFRDIIGKLMDAGIINGDGSDPVGHDDVIDLSHDQVRTIIFLYRGGAFDRKLIAEGMDPVVGKINTF